jgi:hypothetical protein
MEQNNSSGVGWFILGFFIPLVGLVLYLLWKNNKPQSANSAGWGALASVGLVIIANLLF